jgi:uncharacterized membrane protein YhaH (DUF805 family)
MSPKGQRCSFIPSSFDKLLVTLLKRFVLFVVLVPIIAPSATGILQASISGGNPFSLAMRVPGLFLWLAYLNWLLPALAIAIVDRLVASDERQRLWALAAAGYVSPFITEVARYGLLSRSWQWSVLMVGVVGAIAALVTCLLIDQLTKERLGRVGSTFASTIKFLRRYPHSAEE